MSMNVQVVHLEAQPAIAIRVVVPMFDLDVGELFGGARDRLAEYVVEHDLATAGAPYARYAEFGPERADVEIGFPLVEPVPGLAALEPDNTIGATELPGGEVAEVRHIGPYPEVRQAYEAAEAWFAESGRSPGGAPWESYVVAPEDVDHDPARLETLVLWPLAPAG
jgi:effector-binding domain-containing protein